MRQTVAMGFLLGVMAASVPQHSHGAITPPQTDASALRLTTTAWPDGGDIPVRYTQASPNPTSPGFRWSDPPVGTMSFLFLMRDIDDGREGEGKVLWLIWHIPAAAFGLAGDVPPGEFLPSGARQAGTSGPFYTGPDAPADGPKHRYVFELLALDIVPTISAGNLSEIYRDLASLNPGHILGKASWTGLYRRAAQ